MEIGQRQIGDVVIFDLERSITEHEDIHAIRGRVDVALASGVRKIVLNLERVAYVNSTGLGGIVSVLSVVSRAGGMLWMSHPTKRLDDLFTLTKLPASLMIVHSVEEALKESDAIRFQATCPRCGPECWMPFDVTRQYQTCPLCAVAFSVSAFVSNTPTPVPAQVTNLRFPVYDGESVDVAIGAPTTVTIDGRLDLFASEVIEDAVRMLPVPQAIVFRVGTGDISSPGMEALLRLCDPRGSHRAVISVAGGSTADRERWTTQHQAIHASEERAIQALGQIRGGPSLRISVRRSDV